MVEDKCWTHWSRQLLQYPSEMSFFLFLLLIQQHALPINHSCLTDHHDCTRGGSLPAPDNLATNHGHSETAKSSWAMAAPPELMSCPTGVSWSWRVKACFSDFWSHSWSTQGCRLIQSYCFVHAVLVQNETALGSPQLVKPMSSVFALQFFSLCDLWGKVHCCLLKVTRQGRSGLQSNRHIPSVHVERDVWR